MMSSTSGNDQLNDPAEASGKISGANSRCQTDIQVAPWSHPAASWWEKPGDPI